MVSLLAMFFGDIGSVLAERAGQGEVGWFTDRVQTAWLCLGLALERPWLALGGPFPFFFGINGPRKEPPNLVGPSIPAFKDRFSVTRVSIF